MQPYNTELPTLWVLDALQGKVYSFIDIPLNTDFLDFLEKQSEINGFILSECQWMITHQNAPYVHHKHPDGNWH
jgi:hypothetical protein